jgi:hypothetical protein
LIVCALRAVLNAAVEDGLINNNPASKVGKFAKTDKPAHQTSAMTRRRPRTSWRQSKKYARNATRFFWRRFVAD